MWQSPSQVRADAMSLRRDLRAANRTRFDCRFGPAAGGGGATRSLLSTTLTHSHSSDVLPSLLLLMLSLVLSQCINSASSAINRIALIAPGNDCNFTCLRAFCGGLDTRDILDLVRGTLPLAKVPRFGNVSLDMSGLSEAHAVDRAFIPRSVQSTVNILSSGSKLPSDNAANRLGTAIGTSVRTHSRRRGALAVQSLFRGCTKPSASGPTKVLADPWSLACLRSACLQSFPMWPISPQF